ncbi:type I phosphodiesterase / nucleotide pyrophosphatase domain-containing protein [Ditylenchus destructor]|uniref:Type I phosphodiesterase / nucleotide pyrophosphatase domain-containing protein n=1 Tax=Ditylenchus destructor TaxID=166010 RepID=A0AAD4NFI6_9BILA|nr:type I phosphodiesterase / nucleotide pyrophosphatase domain-containing protein [Ditylenchus destructor]
MMFSYHSFTLPIVATLVLSTTVAVANSVDREPVGQNLIILLIDGYGATLFNRTNAKLQHGAEILLQNGVQAEYMTPVFPTQSYPNWYSLVTGLYVENHNFTSDFMYDQETSMLFQRDMGDNDTDYRWWTMRTAPLWYTVGKAGIDVHCYWFATCHRAFVDMVVQVPQDRRHSFKNENTNDLLDHLPRIMKHIKKYQAYRQQLVLLRYDGVAKALKMFGEDADPTVQALSHADVHIRKIQEEMESHELMDSTNFIVLSDHGLMKIEEEDQFYIEECLADFSRVKRVVNSLAFMFIYPQEGEEDTVYFELKVCDQWAPVGDYEDNEVPLVSVYRKHEIPEKYHWRDSGHIGPIVLMTRPGVILLTRQLPSTDVSEGFGRDLKMVGGWDNEHPEMQSIFLGRGPAFKVEHKIGPIGIVDVYQLVMSILGVNPGHSNNGTWENVEDLLADGWESRRSESHSSNAYQISTCSGIVLFIISFFFVYRHLCHFL